MKQRITRKMKRELKSAVNPLEELLIIIKQYFRINSCVKGFMELFYYL